MKTLTRQILIRISEEQYQYLQNILDITPRATISDIIRSLLNNKMCEKNAKVNGEK